MNLLVNKFVINDKYSIAEALKHISKNMSGIVFIVDSKKRLIGSFSDGDYRKASLRKDLDIDIHKDQVTFVMNQTPKYIYNDEYSREALLNFFSTGFSFIPSLDSKKRVIKILSIENAFKGIPNINRVFSKAPLRCSLAGGGTDLYEFYKDHGGAIISFSINQYVHCLIEDSNDGIQLDCKDINLNINIKNKLEIEEKIKKYPNSELVLRVVQKYLKEDAIKISIWSDVHVGSGLAASTSLVVALIKGLDKRYSIQRSRSLLAEEAFELERIHLKQGGGWQDQYLASYGGLNLIEFSHKKGNSIKKIPISHTQKGILENCLLLVNTNMSHDSKEQQAVLIDSFSDKAKVETLKTMARRAKNLYKHLSEGNIDNLGTILHKNWILKKSTSKAISNKKIDEIYERLMSYGAVGGKLLGSGSGGFFLVYVNLNDLHNFKKECYKYKFEVLNIQFDNLGAVAWEIS
ncbi:hypothetical protein N9C24_02015 [Gammaproteobacteria bacterium]|nr:hypothetical protein [Gammaproteobacteria bacterium]